jgi:hypothetical protein
MTGSAARIQPVPDPAAADEARRVHTDRLERVYEYRTMA